MKDLKQEEIVKGPVDEELEDLFNLITETGGFV